MRRLQQERSAMASISTTTFERLRAWCCCPVRHSSNGTRGKTPILLPQLPKLVMPTLTYPRIAASGTTAVSTARDSRACCTPTSGLHLRGGARRKVRPLADEERLPGWLWFFAGGVGPGPTGKQLRKWKTQERAAKERRRAQRPGGGLLPALKALFKGKAPEKGSATPKTSKSKSEPPMMSGGNGGTGETAEGGTGEGGTGDQTAPEATGETAAETQT